jgi:hypothetical protein
MTDIIAVLSSEWGRVGLEDRDGAAHRGASAGIATGDQGAPAPAHMQSTQELHHRNPGVLFAARAPCAAGHVIYWCQSRRSSGNE